MNTSINRSKILDKAKKLKELADRGVGGEKDNAKDFLDKYMAKHNISIHELNVHKMSDYYAKMSDAEFKSIMFFETIMFGLNLGYYLFVDNKHPVPINEELLTEYFNRKKSK